MTISPARSLPTTVLATVGFAVNSAAWMLVSAIEPYLVQQYSLERVARSAVVAAPLVIGALACVPVGALTDRYGARWTFPLVSLASSGAVAALAVVRTVPALVLACCVLGIGGTAFTVGAGLVARWDRPGRRGFRLSVFGAGIGGAAIGATVVLPLIGPLGAGTALLATAAVPAGYAVVAAALVRDAPTRRADRSTVRDIAAMLRLSAMRYWVALYAIAAGGLLAMIAYLPTYLNRQYRLDWAAAAMLMAVSVVAAALSRPFGGWLAGRRDAVAVLAFCFAGVGALGVVLAFQPPLPVAAVGFLGVAVGLGTVGGIVCDLVGRTIPRGRAGLVAGVIGATGCLAALLPPLVLAVVERLDGSYEIGLVLLANIALATALHLRMRRELVDDALAYPVTPALPADLDATATTVVAVASADAARSPAETAATLADLAAHHELVIAYGHDESAASGPTALVEALRARLPRFRVTAVFLDAYPHLGESECALLAELLDEGALAVAVVPTTDPGPTARALAVRLAADTTLRLGYDPVDGTHLRTLAEPASPVPG
jgi:NNP family nitrate/nitrite transporter-like MFS transporter